MSISLLISWHTHMYNMHKLFIDKTGRQNSRQSSSIYEHICTKYTPGRMLTYWHVRDLLMPVSKPESNPNNKVHGASMGPTWVLSAPDGPHVGSWTLLSGKLCVIDAITSQPEFESYISQEDCMSVVGMNMRFPLLMHASKENIQTLKPVPN